MAASTIDSQCALFLNTGASDEVHEQAVAALVSESLAAVVEALGAALTDKNPLQRARGVLLLAELLKRVQPSSLAPAQLEFLHAFFRDRARDTPCIVEVISGMTALLQRWPTVPDALVESMIVVLFAEVYVQSMDQNGRQSVYLLMALTLDHNDGAVAKRMRHDFCYGYLQMIDGERDPRNLLLVFGLTQRILQTVPGWERFTDELFDVTACYYPINFQPKPGSPITAQALQDALDGALTAVPAFGTPLYNLVAEKLREETVPGGMWSLVARAVRRWGGSMFEPHARLVWAGLQVMCVGDSKDRALSGARELTQALMGDACTSNNGETSISKWLGPGVEGCVGRLGSDAQGVAAVQLLSSVAGAGLEAARVVAQSGALEAFDLQSSIAREQLSNLINAASASLSSSGDEEILSGKVHPFWGHLEGTVCDDGVGGKLRRAAILRAGLGGTELQEAALKEDRTMGGEIAARAVAALDWMSQKKLLSGDSGSGGYGLAGLRGGVELSEHVVEEAIRLAVKIEESGEIDSWNLASLAALACHGHLDGSRVEQLCAPSSISSASLIQGWTAHGLLRGGHVKTVSSFLFSLSPSALAIALGDHPNRLLHPGPAHPFARQRVLCSILPHLVEKQEVAAIGAICAAVPPVILIGHLESLTPLLLAAVNITDFSDLSKSNAAAGSLRALGALIAENGEDLSIHSDTLLPRVSRLCAAPLADLRLAALDFLLAAAQFPFPRIYPWREAILNGVMLTLDDPKRDVRRRAVQCSNTYHSLE